MEVEIIPEHDPDEFLAFKVKSVDYEGNQLCEKGYFRYNKNMNHSTLVCAMTGGSKTFTTNALMQREMALEQDKIPLFVVYDFKGEYPDPNFTYPYTRLGIESEDNQIKLNPKFFSSALWTVLFERTDLRKFKGLHTIVQEIETEEGDMSDLEDILKRYKNFSDEMGFPEKEYKQVKYFLKKIPENKWISFDDQGLKKYLIDPSLKCLILNFTFDQDFGKAVAHYFFHQMLELKKLAGYYHDILKVEIKKIKKSDVESRMSEILHNCVVKMKQEKDVVKLLKKYNISDENMSTELTMIHKRKINNIIDEAGDDDFGIAKKGQNDVTKRKLKVISSRGRYLDVNLTLIIQSPQQIETLIRQQNATLLLGRAQDPAAMRMLTAMTNLPEKLLGETLDQIKTGEGQFLLIHEGKKHLVEVMGPNEREATVNWRGDRVHHLIF